MKTFRELFVEWVEFNADAFPKQLLDMFSSVLSAFGGIVELPYTNISNEVFEIMISFIDRPRKRDNMRCLITLLDRYLEKTGGIAITHPTLTDEQAVWMILNIPQAIQSNLIRRRVHSISDTDLPFETLGAKHLVNLSGTKCSDTITYRRYAIQLCGEMYGRPLSAIADEEFIAIEKSAPCWLGTSLRCVIRGVKAIDSLYG